MFPRFFVCTRTLRENIFFQNVKLLDVKFRPTLSLVRFNLNWILNLLMLIQTNVIWMSILWGNRRIVGKLLLWLLSSNQDQPDDDFTNVLQAAFASADPKSAKRHRWLHFLFFILGSPQVKAACKYVGEIDHRSYSEPFRP